MITIKSKESERNQAYSDSSLRAWIGKKTEDDTRRQEDTWSKNITYFFSFFFRNNYSIVYFRLKIIIPPFPQ